MPRAARSSSRSWKDWRTAEWPHPWNHASAVFAVVFLLLCVAGLLAWPIHLLDTDLWYHLNTGRYLLEQGRLPHDSFFSFMEPPRPWIDYYWLFQALAYSIHASSGYLGLIFLRALVFSVMLSSLLWFFLASRQSQRAIPWFMFLFVCYGALLIVRSLNMRPHLFTYLFIPLFLCLIERAPRRAVWLPLLALLWCNLHGVTYPIMVLILGAYLLEQGIGRLRGERLAADAAPAWPWLALSLGAVFLTPHGLRLLPVPFTPFAETSRYINELQLVSPVDLSSISITALAPSQVTFFNVLLVAIGLSALGALARRRIRVSHALLCLGGFVLLSKGFRFMNECALLSLPLLAAHPLVAASGVMRRMSRPAYFACVGLLLAMPVQYLLAMFDLDRRPAYPFSTSGMPQGVVTFLRQADAGGKLLNHPNAGGYLRWALYPRYRIFMDLELPFLFTDADMVAAAQMFGDATVLRSVLARYEPEFLSVPRHYAEFPDVIAEFPRYRPVFFDDAEVLYVDEKRHPTLARTYALKTIEPFDLLERGVDDYLKEEDPGGRRRHARKEQPARSEAALEAILEEAHRLWAIFPDGGTTNQLLAQAALNHKDYETASTHARTLIAQFPGMPIGYRLMGRALRGLRAFEPAVACYTAAIARSTLSTRYDLLREIGLVRFDQGRYPDAFRLLWNNLDFASHETSLDDLYALAVAARRSGQLAQARKILGYLALRIGPDDELWQSKLRKEHAQLNVAASNGEPRGA